MKPIFVDISGVYRGNLYIGALKASSSQINDVLNSSFYTRLRDRHKKIPSYKELRRKEEVKKVVDVLDDYGLEYSIGIFKRQVYGKFESKVQGKQDYKARLMSIFIYLTIRNLADCPDQLVCIEEGEYPNWQRIIQNRLSRWCSFSVSLKLESKDSLGLLIADHLAGFSRRFLGERIDRFNSNRLFIASPNTLKFYVEKEFDLNL